MNSMHDKEKKIHEFLDKYPGIFTSWELQEIVTYARNCGNEFECIPDVVREIYDELDLLPKDKNIYDGFMKLVSDKHNLSDKHIVEIGGGIFPRLGKRISGSLKSGKIVIYDPRLSRYEEDAHNMKLVREKFTRSTKLDGASLLLGLMPCEAADVLLESALDNRVDFVLALCEGGPHGDEDDFFEDEEEWRNCMIKYAMREVEYREMGKLKIKYLKEYGDPYPIIYNDRG